MSPVELSDWPEATPIVGLPPRGRAVCTGVIDAITILPVTVAPAYTAILSDSLLNDGDASRVDQLRQDQARGNHRLRLVWLGRRRVPGISAGVRLRVEGMISLHEGLPTMYNPRYEIIGIQES